MTPIQKYFYQHPDWHLVEEVILEYINPLLDMTTIDTTQPAEHVKAEIIGRRLAYESLTRFVQQSKIVNRELPENKNIFR